MADSAVIAGRRVARVPMLRNGRPWLLLPIVALNVAFVLMPILLIFRKAFSGGLRPFREVLTTPLIRPILVNTLYISLLTTILAVACAYILALTTWRSSMVMRAVIFAFVLLPFTTGVLVKNFAWAILLQDNGVINQFLQWTGVIDHSPTLLHTRAAVVVGMVHYVLPYAFLPIFAGLRSIDTRLEPAAASLGAKRWQSARHVVGPLSLPGVYAATLLVFIISTGFFITPVVLGGPQDQMAANLVAYYAREIVDFRAASILALLITLVVAALTVAYQRLPKEGQYGAV